MNNRVSMWTFLLGIVAIACSSSVSAQGLMYKVYGGDVQDTSYVYGTFHTRDSRAFFLKKEIKQIILSVDVVAGEVNMDDAKDQAAEMAPLMILPNDTVLANLYTPEEYERIEALLKDKLGLQAMLCSRLKPFFVMAMLSEKMLPGDEKHLLDEWIQKQGKKSGREIAGLETAMEALSGLDSMTLREQADWLLEMVDDWDGQLAIMEDLNRWYVNQEIDSMHVYYQSAQIPGEFDREFLVRRNEYFTDRVHEIMKTKTVFCAVGALHLPGETGLINALRERGLTVEVVETTTEVGK
ncbi:MAG: TraB/GumN family protein [Flavobacteriales bacterium]|nr:TraB/GumN family protein [Flavobacteriales bacterium]